MKKIFVLLILMLSIVSSGCKSKEEKFDNYDYFSKHTEWLQKIVNVENNKAPLTVQEYNKIKNNVVKIEFKKLTITHGTSAFCKGYFTTVWTIKSEYFAEEEYEYLIPCEEIHYNPKASEKEYLTIAFTSIGFLTKSPLKVQESFSVKSPPRLKQTR